MSPRSAVVTIAIICGALCVTQASAGEPDWSGFYAGVHAGHGWSRYTDESSENAKGFIGGLHGGYQWQFEKMISGVEADFDFSDIKWNTHKLNGGNDYDAKAASKMFGSVRVRLGYDLGSALIFGTVGGAWRRWEYDVSFTKTGKSFSGTSNGVGAVFGAGAEYKITNNLVGRVEGNYYYFPSSKISFASNNMDVSGATSSGLSENMFLLTTGLSWKF